MAEPSPEAGARRPTQKRASPLRPAGGLAATGVSACQAEPAITVRRVFEDDTGRVCLPRRQRARRLASRPPREPRRRTGADQRLNAGSSRTSNESRSQPSQVTTRSRTAWKAAPVRVLRRAAPGRRTRGRWTTLRCSRSSPRRPPRVHGVRRGDLPALHAHERRSPQGG